MENRIEALGQIMMAALADGDQEAFLRALAARDQAFKEAVESGNGQEALKRCAEWNVSLKSAASAKMEEIKHFLLSQTASKKAHKRYGSL